MSDKTPRISAANYFERLKKPEKKNKFNAQRTIAPDGRSFPSKLEAAMWCQLKILEKAGEKTSLKQYSTVRLTAAKISWKVDAECIDCKTGEREWHEAKGLSQSDYLIKVKLWKVYGPGRLYIWRGTAAKPFISETINPKRQSNE